LIILELNLVLRELAWQTYICSLVTVSQSFRSTSASWKQDLHLNVLQESPYSLTPKCPSTKFGCPQYFEVKPNGEILRNFRCVFGNLPQVLVFKSLCTWTSHFSQSLEILPLQSNLVMVEAKKMNIKTLQLRYTKWGKIFLSTSIKLQRGIKHNLTRKPMKLYKMQCEKKVCSIHKYSNAWHCFTGKCIADWKLN